MEKPLENQWFCREDLQRVGKLHIKKPINHPKKTLQMGGLSFFYHPRRIGLLLGFSRYQIPPSKDTKMNRFHTKPSLFCLGGIYIRRKGFLRTLAVNRDNQGYLLTCYKPCFFWHAGLSLAMFEGCNVHVEGY